jgi:hypothetical protein
MASGAVKKDKEVQITIIVNCAGPQIIDIYDQYIWDEEGDEKKHSFIKRKFIFTE